VKSSLTSFRGDREKKKNRSWGEKGERKSRKDISWEKGGGKKEFGDSVVTKEIRNLSSRRRVPPEGKSRNGVWGKGGEKPDQPILTVMRGDPVSNRIYIPGMEE